MIGDVRERKTETKTERDRERPRKRERETHRRSILRLSNPTVVLFEK